MSRILKLLKTLCRQAPVLAFMALATSGLATEAEASGWKPPLKTHVTFISDSGRESSRSKIDLKAPKNYDVTFKFESPAGHDSNAYCNHRAWIVDWKVEFNNGAHNTPIELTSEDYTYDKVNKKYVVPIEVCRRGIGNTFKVIWTAKSGMPFDSGADHCSSSTSCYTDVEIVEEDPPVATLVLTPTTIDESGSTNTSTVTATLDKAADEDVTISVSPAVDGEFTLSPNSDLTISAGSKTGTGTVTITAVDNQVDAPDKTVKVSATASGAGVEAPEGKTLTIRDDDTRGLVISKNALSVAEGGTDSYTVKLATEPTGTVAVAIASNNTDVTVSPASLTFHASGGSKPWNTAQTVTVTAGQDDDTNDDSAALDHTTTGGDYSSETGSVTVTVNDDDGTSQSQPAASFDSGSSSVAESAGTRNVRVNLSQAAPSGGLTLGYSVAGTATAGSGNDFTIQNSGTVSVAAGASTANISVAIDDDSAVESDETVILTLTTGTGYTLGSTRVHTLTISDNDATSSACVSVQLLADVENRIQSASTLAGAARWTQVKNALTGQGNAITLAEVKEIHARRTQNSESTAQWDPVIEALECLGGTTSSQPVITINSGNAVTEGTAASFTVHASTAPSASLEVNLNVSEDTSGSQDYVASGDEGGKTVTIDAGSSTATFTVDTVPDSTDEPNGLVTVAVGGGTDYSVGSPSSASVTVNDDDDTPSSSGLSSGGDRLFSIDDATAMEKDETISFTVRLSAATRRTNQASVRVATRDVTAVGGHDYRSLNTLVVFQAGETEKVVKVELIDDAHNEGTETFEVVLSNPSNARIGDGVATGTINNADYVPQSELAHFGRSVANHVLEGVIGRISSPRSPGASARIAGNVVGKADRAPDPDCPGCGILSTDKRVEKFDREEILTDSSFVLNGQDDSSHNPAFWGRGTRSYFRDKPGNLSVDGEVTSFMLGADLGWSERKIIGLALIRSSGKIDHMEKPGAEDPNTGMTKLTLTALVPYAGWKINDSIDIWGALGHGNGKMELDLNAGDTSEMIKTGFDWTMAAAGLRGEVVRPGPDGGPRLTALLDGYRVRTSSKETEGLAASKASVTRLRAGLEASWEMQLEDGSILIPRMETNLIQETGDVGSGFGLELVGGLSWSDPDTGLAIDLSARRLRSHDSPGRKDHGYSMALVYDPNPESERGLSVSMRQDRGNSESTMNGLLTSGLPETAAEDSISSQWTTELAYGFPVIDGSFTGSPHAGIEETDDYRDYKVGWRLTPAGPQAPDLSFDINAARRERLLSNSADHRLGVGLVAEW